MLLPSSGIENKPHKKQYEDDSKDRYVQNRTYFLRNEQQQKLSGLSPQANYTDRATAACQRSYDPQHRENHNILWNAIPFRP
jgi:hypothetical protein